MESRQSEIKEPHRNTKYSYCWRWKDPKGQDLSTYSDKAFTLEELKEHIDYTMIGKSKNNSFALDFEDDDIKGETYIGHWHNGDTEKSELATHYRLHIFRVGEQENKDVHYK